MLFRFISSQLDIRKSLKGRFAAGVILPSPLHNKHTALRQKMLTFRQGPMYRGDLYGKLL